MSEAFSRPLLYLIDALPYVFRAYFAVGDMVSPQGALVHAVYGFTAFLCQLLRHEPLTHIAVAFDESLTSSFRNAFFPAYKANRELPPPDLARQLAYCQAVARALGLAVFVDHQYEADDLIGALARQATQADMPVVIVSNDKDLMQLVSTTVTLYDFARGVRYDPAGVLASMGVRPEQIPDLLALQGDPVDNIPGVRGSSLRQKLAAGEAAARVSKRLATIAVQAPVTYDAAALRYGGAIATEVTRLFAELGFQRLHSRIPRWQPETLQ
jgi:5'-3' exonuclease